MSDTNRVLIADDEENIRLVLRESLRREGLEVVEAADGQTAIDAVEKETFALAILDVKMPRVDGIQALERIRQLDPALPVVMITAHGGRTMALEATRLGAYDYFEKPFEMQELRIVVKRALERRALERQVQSLEEQLRGSRTFQNIIGESPAMKEVLDLVSRVMSTDATALITGESGTGKELIADAIHYNGPRAAHPLMKVNCAAIPEPLLESELFGHERGSFTGAIRMKPGKFELADRGTIFLDEIGEMPVSLQAKLLRVLQEKEVERVGGTRPIRIDARILAATNKDLADEVDARRFREDLYFRLNVIPIHLPPLRRRREDIPVLVSHFVTKANTRHGKSVFGFKPAAMDLLQAHDWPGNIRELENVVQRAVILSEERALGVETLPVGIREPRHAETPSTNAAGGATDALEGATMPEKIEFFTARVEERLIREALKQTGGHRQETADLLGISRKSLHNKMLKHKLFGAEEDIYEGERN